MNVDLATMTVDLSKMTVDQILVLNRKLKATDLEKWRRFQEFYQQCKAQPSLWTAVPLDLLP